MSCTAEKQEADPVLHDGDIIVERQQEKQMHTLPASAAISVRRK
jgi:hypothetical protein